MNVDTVSVSHVPGVADGVLSATITDAWFDAERTAHIVEVARRIQRLHHKAARRLAIACGELDEALQDHPLEMRLRDRLLWPLERDCLELAAVAERVHMRLSLFAPARSKEHFDQGMALQLADLQAEQGAPAEPPPTTATKGTPMPYGYWISEDSFNRLERARSAALLLASVDERMAVPFDAVAFSAAYVHEDLATVVAGAKHRSQLEADDDAA
ncbi:hypothetical protein [Stenotrophomonas maltophilia]|uniref:hypothetical protein n=1 Tax=Stenotrophomonas maltophilia TaxID=40324 RepID=UPI0007F02DA4|nr:hypothetical protein [Stenotrophomonas maltophilia]OBU53746.1 hypothetical protein A9K69_08125 [Stenotrophomonas maltophilia]